MNKNKKILIPIIIAVTVTLLIAFFMAYYFMNKKEEKDVAEYLKGLKSYTCSINIEVENSKQHISYTGKQMYRLGKGYRLELNKKKRIMIYRENKIYVYDAENNKSYILPLKFDDIYNMSFVGEYIGMLYTNENINYSIKNIKGVDYVLIKILIPNQNKNMNYAVLYVDLKGKFPTELRIYDIKNEEKLKIKYEEFQPNVQIDEKTFEPVKM